MPNEIQWLALQAWIHFKTQDISEINKCKLNNVVQLEL